MTSKGTNHFGIRDNHTHGKVADFLAGKIAGSIFDRIPWLAIK